MRKKKTVKVQCLNCGMILQSKDIHDFQHCDCQNYTFVDDGSEYCRYGGKDMSKILLINPDGSTCIIKK
ncbi:MAG: DUF7695 domain-containing protein [Nitrososphaerota archaeon]